MLSMVKDSLIPPALVAHLRRIRVVEGGRLPAGQTYRRLPDGETEVPLRLADAGPTASVRQLAGALGASERQLRRAFVEAVGLSPKQYLRVLRFRRVLDEARRTAAPSWSDLAASAGYYDQAHLIADFGAMTGATPAAWI